MKLKRATTEVNNRVEVETEPKQLRKLKDSQSVLAEIADYAFNLPKSEHLRNKLKIFWNSNFDYFVLSEQTGEPYNSVRVTMHRVSKMLYDQLGSNWYFFIMSDKPLDAYIDFLLHTGKGGGINVFPFRYKDMFPTDNSGNVYKVEDCVEELDFLKSITTISIKRQIENLDSDKLSFIFSVLNGEQAAFGDMQKKLWFYICGKKEFKELINELRDKRL